MGSQWYDAAVTLAFLAGVTERVALLSHVVVLPYRHPLVTAKAYATLDRLSGGRAILGVGSGHVKPEFQILGVPYEERGRLTDEYMGAIRAAWSSESAAFDGATVQFRDVRVAPRPIQRDSGHWGPPMWIGGNTRAAVRRVGRHGDGWIPWQVTCEEFAEGVREARRLAACRRASLAFIAPLHVATDDGADVARERVGAWRHAGATGFHVGFAHRTFEELVSRIEWFAATVMRDTTTDAGPNT
jgi:probable F420-dependent oxidoreductase